MKTGFLLGVVVWLGVGAAPVQGTKKALVGKSGNSVQAVRKVPASDEPSPAVAALFDAARKGDNAAILRLLAKGVPVDPKVPDGVTPLMEAAMMNHPDTVQLLLDHGADAKARFKADGQWDGLTALIIASWESNNILSGAHVPQPPAGYAGHAWQYSHQHPEEMRAWEARKHQWLGGYGEIIRMLVAHGADVNAQLKSGETAINNAASEGDLSSVQFLLDRGARLDLPTQRTDFQRRVCPATVGYDALLGAAYRRNPAIVKSLLAHGAIPNTLKPAEMTPLGEAAEKNDLETAKLLLSAGADINAYDGYGHTAFMLAHTPEMIGLLKQVGAKVLPQGPHPNTPGFPLLGPPAGRATPAP